MFLVCFSMFIGAIVGAVLGIAGLIDDALTKRRFREMIDARTAERDDL